MYTPQILDHFEHPRNPGAIPNPDASAHIENPACGDTLQLTLRLSSGRIDQIGFLAKGCVCSMACASALTELVRGKTIQQARELKREDLLAAVGALPAASMHASHLAMDALAAALKKLK